MELLIIALFIISTPCLLFSQDTIGDTDIEVYTLSGSIGLQGHAYTTSQDFNRREPLGALTSINLDYSFLGFRSGLDIRYNTDDDRLRQSINRFSFYGSVNVNVSAGLSYNHNESNNGVQTMVNENMQINGNISANYRIASGSSLQLNLRSQNNSIVEGTGQDFSEMEGRIEFRQRF